MQNAESHSYPFGAVPKRLNDFFALEHREIVGRKDELAQVRRDLLAGHATVLVNGIGGIGKTTIARKYVEIHWADYRHIVWLTVAAPQTFGHDPHKAAAKSAGYSPLRDAFLRQPPLWQSLGIKTEVEQCLEGKDLNAAFQHIAYRLGQLQDCLVVIDNANDATDLLENRPALKSMNAHVLVTSRAKPKEWNIVAVNELPLPQALDLFRQCYAHPSLAFTSPADLETLAETLLRHTLLLELVGKSASPEGNNIPFPRLMESLRQYGFHARPLNDLRVDAGDHADGQNLRRQATVEEYVALIFNHISQLGDDYRGLLKAMTLLPPVTTHGREFLTEICQQLGQEFRPNQAEFLVQYGWLHREALPEGGVGYWMHPLISDVAFRELGVTAEWADVVIKQVVGMIAYNNLDAQHDLSKKRAHQPLAEHLGKLFWEAETEAILYLLDQWAIVEAEYGFYGNAARLGERALSIAEKSHSEEIVAGRKSNLALVYTSLGQYERARDLLELALASDLKIFGTDHPRVAVRQSNLADVYRSLGQYERARDLLEAALASELKSFGADDPILALTRSGLGLVYGHLGQYERAQDLLEVALASKLKNFGADHPSVAVSQSNLADVYRSLGQYERARDLLELALASSLKNFGADHPNMANRRNKLAHIFLAEKNYSMAIEQFKEALCIVEKTLGREHPYYKMFSQSLEDARRAAAEPNVSRVSNPADVSNFSYKSIIENERPNRKASHHPLLPAQRL